jgi:cell division protein FtsZ
VKTIMAGMGYAVRGTATAKGEGRATAAAQAAIASPLLEAGAIDGARGILINITGSSSLRLAEVNEASTIIQSAAHEDANIIFGAVLDEKMKDEVKITVIATGFREVRPRRDQSASVFHGARAATATATVNATYDVPAIREPKAPIATEPIPQAEPEMPEPQRQGFTPYVPENLDDIDSEIVRHAEPLEETLQRQKAVPETVETRSSSVEIRYDADDLEIPAFLRKRGEN